MTNRRTRRRSAQQGRIQDRQGQRSIWRDLLRSLVAISKKAWTLLGVAAVLVTLTSVMGLLPKISVSLPPPLDPSKPLSQPFTITNEGYFALNNVGMSCAIRYIRDPACVSIKGAQDYSSRIQEHEFERIAPVLEPGEKYTKLCPIQDGCQIKQADIAVVVSFRPAWFPFFREKLFRFRTTEGADGNLYYYPQPASKQYFR